LFTTSGARLLKLAKCWNTAVFNGLTTDKKFGFLRLFGRKLSCIWPQGNKAS